MKIGDKMLATALGDNVLDEPCIVAGIETNMDGACVIRVDLTASDRVGRSRLFWPDELTPLARCPGK